MDYIIVLQDKIKIPITTEERDLILKASTSGAKAYCLERTGEVVALRPFPSIVLSERTQKKVEDKRYECAAGNYHSWGYSCGCFSALPTISELYPELEKLQMKNIPQLSYQEQLQARAEGGEKRAGNLLRSSHEID